MPFHNNYCLKYLFYNILFTVAVIPSRHEKPEANSIQILSTTNIGREQARD